MGFYFARIFASDSENVIEDVLAKLRRPLTSLVTYGVRSPLLLTLLVQRRHKFFVCINPFEHSRFINVLDLICIHMASKKLPYSGYSRSGKIQGRHGLA